MVLWILVDVLNFSGYHIFNFKQTQKCQHCQLCVLRENSIIDLSIFADARESSMILGCEVLNLLNSDFTQ